MGCLQVVVVFSKRRVVWLAGRAARAPAGCAAELAGSMHAVRDDALAVFVAAA
jgi:hypothetical protein